MESRVPGFPGEYLWELDIARVQLLALAEAAPEELYAWRPVEGARSFSAVLVHIAVGNLGLLRVAGVAAAEDLYGEMSGDVGAMVRTNLSFERTVTRKEDVLGLLTRSFEAVRKGLATADLDEAREIFGERTTVRRVYLRMLTHSHEHMGQAVAYMRTFGMQAPWPDPLRDFESEAAGVG